MPYTAIQKTYHSGTILLEKEKRCIETLYKNFLNGSVTEDVLLEKCIKHRHFRFLHLTTSNRTKLVSALKKQLKKAKVITQFKGDFEELYQVVFNAIGNTKGIGRTMLYDITRMIGYCHQVYPQNYVYLHAGAKEGAKNILKKKKATMKRLSYREPIGHFVADFPNEDSMYIEDMLCIYKDRF